MWVTHLLKECNLAARRFFFFLDIWGNLYSVLRELYDQAGWRHGLGIP